MRCFSFKINSIRQKSQGLYSNDMQNHDARFEALIGTNAMSKAEFGSISGTVRDVIKMIVASGATLFSGLEQGTRKCKRETLLLVGPSQMREAKN